MVENADSRAGRRVVAWASVSMDGFTSGPGGPQHDTWLYEHAGQEATSAYFEGIWRGASTALLGRTMAVVPAMVGGGLRLFPDGLPASTWELAETTTLAHGAVGLHYRRW